MTTRDRKPETGIDRNALSLEQLDQVVGGSAPHGATTGDTNIIGGADLHLGLATGGLSSTGVQPLAQGTPVGDSGALQTATHLDTHPASQSTFSAPQAQATAANTLSADALHAAQAHLAADQATQTTTAAALTQAQQHQTADKSALSDATHHLADAQATLARAQAALAADTQSLNAQSQNLHNTQALLNSAKLQMPITQHDLDAYTFTLSADQIDLSRAQAVQSRDAQVVAHDQAMLDQALQVQRADQVVSTVAHSQAAVFGHMPFGAGQHLNDVARQADETLHRQEQVVAALQATLARDQATYQADTQHVTDLSHAVERDQNKIAVDRQVLDILKADVSKDTALANALQERVNQAAQRVHNDQAAVAQAQQAVNQAQASVNAAQVRVDADAADVRTQLAANAAATSAVEHDKAVLDELKKAQAAGKSVSKP